MLKFASFAIAMWTALFVPAHAQSPVVVELFTSQGCSSCPPADALLHELAGRDDVIALALHVDYWDYIGWEDAFADPAHTQRQRQYALEAGRRSVYTPQMVINGQTAIVGTKPMALSEAIAHYATKDMGVELALARTDEGLEISAQAPNVSGSLMKKIRNLSIL